MNDKKSTAEAVLQIVDKVHQEWWTLGFRQRYSFKCYVSVVNHIFSPDTIFCMRYVTMRYLTSV
ncbi:MAG: hypothetical protein KIH00_00735, partial [Lachnospiraceae bacterium]|nr:hypothetical protein [Lachnospiraceae bacterium]